MSIRRFKNKRDEAEGPIVDALRKLGFTVLRIDTPVDLIVAKHGQTWLCEVKSGKAKLQLHQQEFIENWPGRTAVLRSLEDVADFARDTGGTA